jgi:F-type H+-transporting ATPase subunit c
MTPEMLHYFSATLTIGLGAAGSGIGQGIAALGVQNSFMRQPAGNLPSFRAMIIGLALIESGAIISLVSALLTLFGAPEQITWPIALAEFGTALAVGFAAAAIGIASSFAVKASAEAIGRQPFFSQKILTFMLIAQSIIEAPVVFAFIVTLVIRSQFNVAMSLVDGMRCLAAGLVLALGCLGPSMGQAIFSHATCESIGVNKKAYSKIFPFALLSQAMIETPMIFCLLLSFFTLYSEPLSANAFVPAIKFIVAAATLGIGSIATAIGIGYVSAKACRQIAADPENYAALVRTTIVAVAFIESSVIYALIISLLLIMKVA